VELAANLTAVMTAPAVWAVEREVEGWDVVSVADDLWSDSRPFLTRGSP